MISERAVKVGKAEFFSSDAIVLNACWILASAVALAILAFSNADGLLPDVVVVFFNSARGLAVEGGYGFSKEDIDRESSVFV